MSSRTAIRIVIWGTVVMALLMLPIAVSGTREERGTFLGVLLLAATVVGLAWARRHFREEPIASAAEAEADRLGLRFAADDPFDTFSLPLSLLHRSRSGVRDLGNVMWGTWRGYQVRVFDHSYSVGENDVVRLTCAMVADPIARPHLVIAREAPVHHAATAIGLRDIEFENEEFNRAFRVTGADRRFAHAVVDARMIAWLLSLSPEWTFELGGGWLLCAGRGRMPWAREEVLETTVSFLDRVPVAARSIVAEVVPPRPDPLPRPPILPT